MISSTWRACIPVVIFAIRWSAGGATPFGGASFFGASEVAWASPAGAAAPPPERQALANTIVASSSTATVPSRPPKRIIPIEPSCTRIIELLPHAPQRSAGRRRWPAAYQSPDGGETAPSDGARAWYLPPP